MSKNIIIYGSTIERAFNKLQELLEFNINPNDVKRVLKSSPEVGAFIVDLNNGDRYKAVKANDYARGHRWQYAYIDKDINLKLLYEIILPCFFPENYPDNLNSNAYTEDCFELFSIEN